MLSGILQFRPQTLFYPTAKFNNCNKRLHLFTKVFNFLHLGSSLSSIPDSKTITCARKKRMRSQSQKSIKFILKLVSTIASNLKILPQPLDLVIEEFGSDVRTRKRKRNWLFLGFLMLCGLGLLYGMELEIKVVCGVLGLGLIGVSLIPWSKKRKKDLNFWVCFLGILLGFGLRRVEMRKWIEKIGVCYYPVMEIVRGSKGRRTFYKRSKDNIEK